MLLTNVLTRLRVSLLLLISCSCQVAQSSPDSITPPIWLLLQEEQKTRFEQTIEAYTDPNSNHIFIAAHRGGKENDRQDRAPGNSIANIANAISKEFDIYESDIEILLGNGEETLIVFHDNEFDFLTNTNVVDDKLDDADLAYAKSLLLTYDDDTVSSERIPTLEEFLLAAKDRVIVKFDLKSGLLSTSRLITLFNIIQETGIQNQVLIRGGDFVLTTAQNNNFDTRQIMRRYDSEPTVAEINSLTDNFSVKAISIPNGASAQIIQAAQAKGLIVEVHESQGVSDQQRETDW